MSSNEVIVRFEDVSFEFGINKPILDEVSFSIRRGAKLTIMGQNGAGKSTLFKMITGEIVPEFGEIHIGRGVTIAISRQVIPRDELDVTVREFFQKCFKEKVYDIIINSGFDIFYIEKIRIQIVGGYELAIFRKKKKVISVDELEKNI
jgi:ATPase subunit of ABC transporter with duplicated ATPase domains